MPLRLRFPTQLLPERLRNGLGRRATGLALALLLEGLLALLLLTLSPHIVQKEQAEMAVVNIAPSPEPSPEPTPEPEKAQDAAPKEFANPPPSEPKPTPPEPPKPPVPKTPLPVIIPLTRDQMASADITAPPRPTPAPQRPAPVGPPGGGGTSGDSQRVEGTGPNGEPLYAASWYREPYNDELSGYLSTATGPGWGLIACRTVADFRVEDCVSVGESPQGSNIARAVLAAAWQFRVRPPQIGGRPQVGAWVRIRIDYQTRRAQRAF